MKIEKVIVQLVKDKVEEELKEIFNPENKDKFVDMINDNVNIPLLREKDEEIVFSTLYDLVYDFVKKVKK
tara:strand:+ start:685 stop:894 length:210 start_codon:yes stop_codon:yes gene_type:complete